MKVDRAKILHPWSVMVPREFCGEHNVSLVKYARQEACLNELILLYCKMTLTESCKFETIFPPFVFIAQGLGRVPTEMFATSSFLWAKLPVIQPLAAAATYHCTREETEKKKERYCTWKSSM